ncbi:MAG TPA: hypothetical protein P5567_11705 [Kiritimatiellia bacterium]|nr:hypothetical protein [Kiritimatiellia bacterium]HRZ13105.1 hypothetical protein [Kiritimatiellia bacterium]HSA17526.1 hypothetical protein [Kiritimatiellia bacterium]
MSPGKRILFRLLALLLPLLALATIEAGLRLSGRGGYPAFLREVGRLPSGDMLCLVEPAASKPYFFANPDRPGYAEQSTFVMPKPADVVRIFIIGESAAKGYPQPRNLSMAAFLQEILNSAWTDRKAEVISLGTTAVASFPLVYLVRDALKFEPDLLIFYTGNNEFFGAYGTGSINAAGTLPPSALRVLRALRGLALVQALDTWRGRQPDEGVTLMEEMIGRSAIHANSPLREAAARNLAANLGAMLDAAKAAGVPAIVCTTAANESDLAPLGADNEARARYRRGREQAAAGDRDGARRSFLEARDRDPLPWRPTSQTEEAIRSAAREKGAGLCDIAELFRTESPAGATGRDLVEDHVHLSLRGQARAARAMAEAMGSLPGALRVDPGALAGLPDDAELARRLGANPYDEYRVNHTLRVLYGVPFMKRANPELFARHNTACREAEARMSPGVLAAAREWQTARPHAGGLRPITAMIARALLREGRPAEALPLYEIAARQVPEYTSWHLEYVYFTLACREKLAGGLSEDERAAAARAIAQGVFLLAHGASKTGLTERYVGRLCQLRGEWAEAIPYLLAARPSMDAEDLVACNQALVVSYMKTGKTAEALALADDGIRAGGRFAGIYRKLRDEIERAAR